MGLGKIDGFGGMSESNWSRSAASPDRVKSLNQSTPQHQGDTNVAKSKENFEHAFVLALALCCLTTGSPTCDRFAGRMARR
jgi:hypothetical protein